MQAVSTQPQSEAVIDGRQKRRLLANFDLENADVCFEFDGGIIGMRSMWKLITPS
ncbi:hypothetical protein [Variovorax sp. EBFNA2]|uniref:hypothetical protein n=1 Tax=Variovorax sp. EBFNA2 TaxID=3342097 RepID=UPI0029C02592|nr:hypothetical protein [Variovorax boronicumulans]WPG41337.1 hypothetical protein RZE79_30950 [Variovorax boronicumulans]